MLAPNTPEPRRQKVKQSRLPVHCGQVAWPDYSPALSRVIRLLPRHSQRSICRGSFPVTRLIRSLARWQQNFPTIVIASAKRFGGQSR